MLNTARSYAKGIEEYLLFLIAKAGIVPSKTLTILLLISGFSIAPLTILTLFPSSLSIELLITCSESHTEDKRYAFWNMREHFLFVHRDVIYFLYFININVVNHVTFLRHLVNQSVSYIFYAIGFFAGMHGDQTTELMNNSAGRFK